MRHMPAGMFLRSHPRASYIADPEHALGLDAFYRATGLDSAEHVPLPRFVEYGRWFQQEAVPEIDPRRVASVARAGDQFQLLRIEDGEQLRGGPGRRRSGDRGVRLAAAGLRGASAAAGLAHGRPRRPERLRTATRGRGRSRPERARVGSPARRSRLGGSLLVRKDGIRVAARARGRADPPRAAMYAIIPHRHRRRPRQLDLRPTRALRAPAIRAAIRIRRPLHRSSRSKLASTATGERRGSRSAAPSALRAPPASR